MARALTNKQLAVLSVLRRFPDGIGCKELARTVAEETPCSACGYAGEVDGERCGRCYGRGHIYFDYGAAYVALGRLMKEGLAWRRCKRDEWGDELAGHVYFPADRVEGDDPLEQAWALPAFEGGGQRGS